jgi:hypothetical protein
MPNDGEWVLINVEPRPCVAMWSKDMDEFLCEPVLTRRDDGSFGTIQKVYQEKSVKGWMPIPVFPTTAT